MNKRKSADIGWWAHLKNFIRTNTSLTVIILAALLLELTTAILYYSAQNIIQQDMERVMLREMNALNLCIRNKLATVEVTLNNMSWVVGRDLEEDDWMFEITEKLVKENSVINGSAIAFVPNYYPKEGRWFEPSTVRKADGSIENKQVGSANHDYTKSEFYTVPMATDSCIWCEPYMDVDGSQVEVTTYSVPVYDDDGRKVAVVIADISLDWLEDVMNEERVYKSTQRFLTTGSYNLLGGEDSPMFREAVKILKTDGDKEGYFTAKDKHGDKKHVFYAPIGGKTDWVLINILDDNDAFGKLRRIRFFLLLPVMIGLFIVGFIVWRSSRNLERLREINAEKERIGGELRVASQIQQSMLPGHHLHRDDVDIRGSLVPAREVGGDLYDYFIRDEKLFFCIGDVSGKGAPSAMLMAVTHGLFRSASAHDSNPARIMDAINEVACQGNDTNMFVTMFVGVLDLPTGRLRYCDAGHDAPFIIRGERLEVRGEKSATALEVNPHLPIGLFDDTKYTVQEISIQPDSLIFLYTDGLTEAKNAEHKLFGLERIQAVLNTCADNDSEEVLEKITQSVNGFVKLAEQSDDLTMLAIRYTPKQFESTLTETLVLKNDVHEVTRFSSFIKSVTEKLGIETPLARKLRLAVEEAVVNVISYAYPEGTEGDVTIKIMSDGHTLRFQIIDTGVPFDPTKKEKADTTLSIEERQIGGLGIFLVRELMDTINYERVDGKNILTLIKTFKK
jgi:sigma-B regulation protein RsbU (phosphoserine phosphatase)